MRDIVPSDLDALKRIIAACREFSPAEISCAIELLETVIDNPGQKDYEVIIAEADNHVAGYSMFGPVPLTQDVYDLYWIAIDPACHGRGIGSKLLNNTENRLIRKGVRMLCLETSSQEIYSKTRQFYLDRNYRQEARIRDFYRPGDDRITYVKRFAS